MLLNRIVRLLFPALICFVQADTIDQIKQRGYLICGISGQSPGFSHKTPTRDLVGFDVDGCRSLATVIVGTPDAVQYVETTMRDSFKKLTNHEVDVLYRHTSMSRERENGYNVSFPIIQMIEGQYLLVKNNVEQPRICVMSNHNKDTLSKHQLHTQLNLKYKLAEHWRDAASKINTNYCDGVFAEQSTIQFIQQNLKQSDQFSVSDSIANSEISPVIRNEDERLAQIIQTLFAVQIIAEEVNIHSNSDASQILKYISNSNQYNQNLGLVNNWQVKLIKYIGHYGEMFDRHFGPNSITPIDRSQNHLWKNGGLMVSNL